MTFFSSVSYGKTKIQESQFAILWKKLPETLNPLHFDALSARDESLISQRLIHCSLFKNKEEEPYIAESWKWLDAFTTLEIKIKKDFKFSDGSLLTVKDIIETMTRLKNRSSYTVASSDPYSLTIKFKSSHTFNVAFLQKLQFGILPESWLRSDKSDQDYDMPSCGLFMIDRFSDNVLLLKRNPFFPLPKNKKNIVSYKTIQIKILPNEMTRLEEIRNGTIDFAANVFSYDHVDDIAKKIPSFKVITLNRPVIHYLEMNTKVPLLSTISLRKAIAQRIDREKIVNIFFKRFAIPILNFAQPFESIVDHMFDFPSYTSSSIKKNGGSVKTHFKFGVPLDTTLIAAGKAISAELQDMGLNIELMTFEQPQLEAEISGGNLSMWLSTWDLSLLCLQENLSAIPAWEREILKSCQIQDKKQRNRAWREFQKQMFDDYTAIPLWQLQQIIIQNKNADLPPTTSESSQFPTLSDFLP